MVLTLRHGFVFRGGKAWGWKRRLLTEGDDYLRDVELA
jgi:hypothetical protein